MRVETDLFGFWHYRNVALRSTRVVSKVTLQSRAGVSREGSLGGAWTHRALCQSRADLGRILERGDGERGQGPCQILPDHHPVLQVLLTLTVHLK